MAITLPHGGGANYKINLSGDLKDVSSHLPAPLDKMRGSAMPLKASVTGDLRHFDLEGAVANHHRFNSRWLLGKALRLDRGIWLNDARATPTLPETRGMMLNLPPLDGDSWLKLLMAKEGSSQNEAKKKPGKESVPAEGLSKNALPGKLRSVRPRFSWRASSGTILRLRCVSRWRAVCRPRRKGAKSAVGSICLPADRGARISPGSITTRYGQKRWRSLISITAAERRHQFRQLARATTDLRRLLAAWSEVWPHAGEPDAARGYVSAY